MLERWLYRSRQFFAALAGPPVSREDMAEALDVLGPQLYKIFSAMPRQYRQHSLNVYRRVRQAGCDDPVVLQAALLHDSGKFDPVSGCYVTIAHRVIVVLLGAVSPGRRLLRWLSRPTRVDKGRLSLDYWRYPFYLSEQHAALGAQIAAKYGGSPKLVEIIRHHHTHVDQAPELRILQAADDKS